MKHTDEIAHLLKQYKGQWVALDDDEKYILGCGDNMEIALNEAKARGCKSPKVFKLTVKTPV